MEKPKAMTAEEYKALKTRLGSPYSAIASSVGVSQRTAIRWASSGLRGASVTVLRRRWRGAALGKPCRAGAGPAAGRVRVWG